MKKDPTKLVKNSLGGLNDMDKVALARAQKADLVTLPKDIRGTNCGNCQYITEKTHEHGYCSNKKVLQYVNHRMCCALWDAKGTFRPFIKEI